RAGARDRARPRAHHVRRAVRGPRPHFHGRGGQSDPHAERRHRRHVARRLARRAGMHVDQRLRDPHGARPHRGARLALRAHELHRPRGAPVRARRARRPGQVPLPGARAGAGLRRARRGWHMNAVAVLGARTLDVLRSFGHAALFFADIVRAIPAAMRRFNLVVTQIHAVGNLSLLIILASGMAVGFVLALQMYYALVTYGATESLGLIVNLSLVRELGPVVAALLYAGRAGTSLTAEIGLMKAGEQIAAMEMMAIDPKSRVLAPRFIGGVVSMPLLAILFSAVGILGAYVVAVLLLGVDAGNFWSIMQSRVDVWRDVGN